MGKLAVGLREAGLENLDRPFSFEPREESLHFIKPHQKHDRIHKETNVMDGTRFIVAGSYLPDCQGLRETAA